MNEAALLAACRRLAATLGLGAVQPQVIGRHSNLVVHLAPSPWVLRVATGTAGPRAQGGHAERELRLLRHLAERGAPALPPAPRALAGPHRVDGWSMTLWPLLALAPQPPEPQAAGRALAQCHAELAALPHRGRDDDRPWAPLDEALRLLAHPLVRQRAAAPDLALVGQRLQALAERLRAHPAPLQWLHGDAHRQNVRQGTGGALWLDWEDACLGPLEWDLAGLVAASRVLGQEGDWPEAALAGWRSVGRPVDEALLADCIEARTAFVCAWIWWLGPNDPLRAPRLAGRLQWLRAKNPGLS
ncbi:aminoglycoside phosphotransferase family protein [Ideonella sp. 4Y16]|uniref:Aminoglycoside phosphotransferase family protein n=1 Tax=Ideonella alba TaxID=2824118 RepID=A0A940YFQ4_9BURK|nr:aminoglycoside phosphotransferase family protein [Ideonella alba]MBQ0931662.1 aminoglycoside phosphotransferase family protein [Ideonella alba]MBQ0944096.1 aminoglycoside phosphotransferase family protein [Ideonella alba]